MFEEFDQRGSFRAGQAAGKLGRMSEQGGASKRGGEGFTFADLFAGIGGFHAALAHAGGRCVFVSEIDEPAMTTYRHNWVDPHEPGAWPVLNTDITLATPDRGTVMVPDHDVLTAGFPCQPFSKSGFQRGMDEARGTLFWNIARILEERRPSLILLENVRNLAGPRHRHEWDVIITTLRSLGYRVSDTPSVFSPHFLPPSRGGTPQVRDRVFIVGSYVGKHRAETATEVAPTVVRGPVDGWDPQLWNAEWILDDDDAIPQVGRYRLSAEEESWISAWDDLVQRMWSATGTRLPGFPLWADAWIPERALSPDELDRLPRWKADFLVKNARFYDDNKQVLDRWRKCHPEFRLFPESRRKLEWQAQDTASLWDTVMHFRPSGIRAKAPTYLPALVAITQTSVIGSRRRRLTPHEAARLQGLPRAFEFANLRETSSYRQVGNGVAVGAAWHVLREHVANDAGSRRPAIPQYLRDAILSADPNPCPDSVGPAGYQFEESWRAGLDDSGGRTARLVG
jgi:DNA (cytosine-5)-methyltransferase 1